MNLLSRYIGKTILLNTLLVIVVLVALSAVFGFIRELDDVGRGDYSLPIAAIYVLLRIPGSAYELFPSAVLLGSLLGMGALASQSELTVMRSAGISIAQIVKSVLMIGLILMAAVVLIGEFVMPRSEIQAQEMRSAALAKRVSISERTGYWARSDNRYINIKTVLPDISLIDVRVYEFDQGQLSTVVAAGKAVQQVDGSWQLSGVVRNDYTGKRVVISEMETEVWPRLVNTELLQGLSVPVESMSVSNLLKQIAYLRSNQLDSRQIELALWTKIANPVATLVMLLLSLPFVFGSQRSGGTGQKIFVGILLGIGFFLINRLFTHLGLAYGLNPATSTLIPLVMFGLIALVGVRRIS